MGFYPASLWAVLIQLTLATAAISQDVTLTSRDGSIEVVGTLLGYDGEFYRVDSIYGELTLDGSGVLCTGPGCPDLEAYVAEIGFSGAASIADRLLPTLIDAFAAQQGFSVTRNKIDGHTTIYTLAEMLTGQLAARFLVRVTSSDQGFVDLLAGDTDISLSMRQASELEIQSATAGGIGQLAGAAQNQVIALDALVPVVSPRNPVDQISPEDLVRIFSGEIVNWNELGGIDAPVALHLPRPSAGMLQVFRDLIVKPFDQEIDADITRHKNSRALVQAVGRDPFAIGLSTLSELQGVRPLVLAGGCGFRADTTPDALKSEDYPLTAPMFLYKSDRRLPAVGREFLRFMNSPGAQLAILDAGFVDQSISRTPVRRQGERLANAISAAGVGIHLGELQRLVTAMTGSKRLSVTFRFDDGSSGMTAQSLGIVKLTVFHLDLKCSS